MTLLLDVRIYAFPALPREMLALISAGRTEASKVWMKCRDLHQAARTDGTKWPNRDSLQRATKGYVSLVNLKKDNLKHPFAWVAGKMKAFLEEPIEKKDEGIPSSSVLLKVGAVTFSAT